MMASNPHNYYKISDLMESVNFVDWRELLQGDGLGAQPRLNNVRMLRTAISDADLEAANFLVAERPADNVLDRPDSFRRERLSGGLNFLDAGWLIHQPANHMSPPPSWMGDFERRLTQLREAADEDGIPFSEDSANAARTFCENHGRSIRPSIFLVGNGNLRLVWENDEGEQIGLQFRADSSKVQCIIFKRRHDGFSTMMVMETSGGVMDLINGNRIVHLLGKK